MQLASCMQVIAALSNLCVDFAAQNNFISSALSDPLCYFLRAEIQEYVLPDFFFFLDIKSLILTYYLISLK